MSSRPGNQELNGIVAGSDDGKGRSVLTDVSDQTLAERIADGDVAAFEVVVRRHGPFIRVFVAKLLDSDYESDEVVQDAFLAAWRQSDQLRSVRSLRAWLVRIASNKAIDRIRARRDHVVFDEREAVVAPRDDSPERVVERRLQIEALSDALVELPEQQRTTWLLRELGGASYQEIGRDLGVPVSTVRGLLARARATLMDRMAAWR